MKRRLLYPRVISAAVMAALGTLALPQVPVVDRRGPQSLARAQRLRRSRRSAAGGARSAEGRRAVEITPIQ